MSGTLSKTEYVGSGPGNSGSDSGTTIVAGGVQYLGYDSGTGTATDTTMSGGTQDVGDDYGTGTATDTTISAAVQNVGDNNGTGYATSTTIDSAGSQFLGVSGGTGTATDTIISGGGYQFVGGRGAFGGTGTATSTTILSGGTQYVGQTQFGTGTAIDTTISGGTQIVDNDGGTATAAATTTTIFSGGVQYVGDELGAAGTATSTTIDSYGTQFVGDVGTGTATDTTISGLLANQFVGYHQGTGTATNTTILSGGTQDIAQLGGATGTATSTTIGAGGTQVVGDGGGTGTATTTIIESGGTQDVGFGAGGVGTATITTIDSGGTQDLGLEYGTGTAISTTIDSGGQQYVGYSIVGDVGTGTATSTIISGGGTQYVGSGATGTATDTTLSGGTQYVEASGTATDTTITSGGLEHVMSGGVANAPVISGGTLQLDSGASIGSGAIDFAAVSGTNGGTLNLTGEGTGATFTSNFTAPISGFAGNGSTAALSDIIDVTDSGNAGDHVVWTQTGASGTLQVENASNTVLESMTLDGTYGQQHFGLTENAGVDQITYNSSAPCYCTGTLIRSTRGDVAVEALAIGDLVLTASGAARPIKWIGHRAYSDRFVRNNPDLLPICFKAGSLADGVPRRDLWVSPKHAMFIDGVLIPAEHLVNGASIVKAERVESLAYWHLELDSHDVLFAEGAPSESFVDDDSRGVFHNAHTFAAMYPDAPRTEAVYCAPRVEDGYILDGVRRRIAQRAGLPRAPAPAFGLLRGYIDRFDAHAVAGWAQDQNFPDGPVCLDIVIDGSLVARVLAQRYRTDLERAGIGDGRHAFALELPAPLARDVPHVVEVRRSADGVAIAGTNRIEIAAAAA